jgi:hypothetical protein
MTTLDQLGVLVPDLLIYLANGMLVILYLLAAHSAALVSLAFALLIMLLPDAQIQARAGYRPSRHEEVSSIGATPRTAQIMTGIVLIAWLIAQWDMGAPVPWIGAVMWFAGLIAVLTLSSQRFNLLWYVKAGIAMYALAVIGSRIYLGYTSHLTAEQWAALVGSSENAATLIASTRGNVTTILLWALWLVVPLGYFSMLVQRVFINPMSIVNPLASAQDMLRALRMRVSR